MSFEHLPFSSFALQSNAPGSAHFVEGTTLTLECSTVGHPLLDSAMRGLLALECDAALIAASLHACVVPAPGAALTITF